MSSSSSDTNIITGLGNVATDTYNFFNGILSNPSVIIIVVGVLLIYITMFFSLGDTNSSTTSSSGGLFSGLSNSKFTSSTTTTTDTSSSMKYFGILAAAIFIILIVINGFQYFFGIDIIAKISNLFSGNPVVDISVDTSAAQSGTAGSGSGSIQEIKLYPQVFNVYPDAKALCSAYGSRLATYKEVEDAYKGGAEWCNYGWSEGQMALFPTQQKTWDKLQKIEGHENDCGRPGINGGYMKNPAVRYGVNCYGYKPQMTAEEEELMATSPIYPKTKKDIAMEQRVQYWKDKLSSVLVSPFNHTSWSKI